MWLGEKIAVIDVNYLEYVAVIQQICSLYVVKTLFQKSFQVTQKGILTHQNCTSPQ